MNPNSHFSPRNTARIAGVLYLVIIVLGVWSEVAVRGAIVVPGDPATTAANVIASEGLFRASIAADAVMAVSDVALGILLFVLLRAVNPTIALVAAAFRLAQTAILGMNLLNLHTALALLTGGAQMTGFAPDQVQAIALASLEAHGAGYDIGLLFFAFNSILTGYLLFRAAFLPRLLGVLMAGAGVVYLTGSALVLLAPAAAAGFAAAYAVPLLAEVSFCVWLLAKGVDKRKWIEQRAVTAAAPA